MWNEVTGKYMDIERKGRRFEMELFVPDKQSKEEPKGGWNDWKKTMQAKKVCCKNQKTETGNIYSALQNDWNTPGEWQLGFVGPA